MLVCTCTYTHLPTLILISFDEEDWTVEGGGAWGGDSEVLEMVTSEVMKLVKSTPPKSLKKAAAYREQPSDQISVLAVMVQLDGT